MAASILSSSTASIGKRKRLLELIERVDLDLDLDEMADAAREALAAPGEAASGGDVVVLDQHRIVEAEAVIDAAAGADRVFLERAQAGRRLARAGDARARALDRGHIARGERSDAAQAAEEIERGALGR